MKKMTGSKCITVCAMCVALCYVLPVAFHAVGLGGVLSPMHIPVLLCGLLCGGWYGLLCGIVGPAVSSLIGGMPSAVMLVRMIPELCVYGFVGGLIMDRVRTGRLTGDVYLALGVAMLAGRIVGGIATAIFYTVTSGVYSVVMWLTGYFVESLPGIVAHLIFIPLLVIALEKARLIPVRYEKAAQEA